MRAITNALDTGVPLRDAQILARHADPAPPSTTTAPEGTSTDTASTSSPHTLPASERSGLTSVKPAPFCCQEGGFGIAECAPALVAVKVVRPVGGEPKPRRGSHAAWCRVASGVRVREVADPKCRCAGVGRPRWILETPRSALPDPLHAS